MTRTVIQQSVFDSEFRRLVADQIKKAKESIIIVTGEISAYNYLDLRNAAEEAAAKGVEINVYATGPDRDIINRLIHNNINVYIGEEDPQEHFMLTDDKTVIISYKEKNRKKPTSIGERRGLLIANESEEIGRKKSIFERLMKNAEKQRAEGEDPLERYLNKQISCE